MLDCQGWTGMRIRDIEALVCRPAMSFRVVSRRPCDAGEEVFDAHNRAKDITHVHYERGGRLGVAYSDGSIRSSAHLHLQKRAMAICVVRFDDISLNDER